MHFGLAPWALDATGSTAFDIEVLASQTMHEGELWMELGYLGTSGSTLPTWDNIGGDIGGTTALTAGTGLANWTGGGGSETSYRLTTTVTVLRLGNLGASPTNPSGSRRLLSFVARF